MRLSKKRREQLVLSFVRVTGGGLVKDLGKLLAAMGARLGGPVSEEELRRAIKWSLRQSRRSGALFERRLRAEHLAIPPEEQIEYASSILTLEPGDIFSCGTCGGVGQGTHSFLKIGDVMETEVESLGKMRNRFVAETA